MSEKPAKVMPMTTPAQEKKTFLTHLRQSGLFTSQQFEEVIALANNLDRGKNLARVLVQKGMLTRFQAEQLLAGRTGGFILGQYRILDHLGEGGMGRVYKAQHSTMNRTVAIKVLMPQLLKTGRAQDMFLREVRVAAQLVHPNIVTAFDANQTNGRYYLVLEYIDGPNLEQLVRARGPLPVGVACEIVRQVSLGLQCAHQLKMVHRDIKPANILLQRSNNDPCGIAKISDFGLARFQSPSDETDTSGTILTRQNTVMGTPDFLSPEQARDLHKADIRSDLYSLGCTFYYLLTGDVPFPGGSSMEKLVRQSTTEPQPIENVRPEVAPEVTAIIRRLMEKNPDNRYQSPTELMVSLAPFCVNIPSNWLSSALPANTDVTPIGDSNPEERIRVEIDEGDALVNTMSPQASPTPLTTSPLPRTSWWRSPLVMVLVCLAALGVLGITILAVVVAVLLTISG